MTVADTLIAALAAGGGMGGVAALISALRPTTPATSTESPAPRSSSHSAAARRYGQNTRASSAEPPAARPAFWSLIPATCACLISGTLIAVIGATTMSLSQPPIVALAVAAAACAALAIWVSGRLLWASVGKGRVDLTLYGAAGLVVAVAALTAIIIAGST